MHSTLCHLLSCSEVHLQLVQLEKRVQGLLTLSVPHSSAKLCEVEAARETTVSCNMPRVNHALSAQHCTVRLLSQSLKAHTYDVLLADCVCPCMCVVCLSMEK